MAKWVTKNQPNKKGRYLVTIKSSFGNEIRQADYYEFPKGNWVWQLVGSSWTSSDVIAWQNLPNPYREVK